MRAAITTLTLIGCADVATTPAPYDETAQTVGIDVARGDGVILADATILAHGGMLPRFTRDDIFVSGMRDGTRYLYKIVCYDGVGKLMPCGETTSRATAIATWTGAGLRHEALWTIRGIDSHQAWVTGTTWGLHGDDSAYVIVDKQATVLFDLDALAIAGGSMTATLDVVRDGEERAFDAIISFERSDRARLTIDGLAWWLDPKTGATSAAVTLE